MADARVDVMMSPLIAAVVDVSVTWRNDLCGGSEGDKFTVVISVKVKFQANRRHLFMWQTKGQLPLLFLFILDSREP